MFDHAMRALDQNGTWGSVKFIGPSTVEGRARREIRAVEVGHAVRPHCP